MKRRVSHEVCCVCGDKFSSYYDGKPYCNKHWLRLYNNGTLELQRRANTCQFSADGDVLTITTKNGDVILADTADYDVLKKYSWCVNKQGYAVANINGAATKMNRYILGVDECKGKIVDHANGNTLDNRRSNLRFASHFDNARNRKPSVKSLFPGIRKTKNGRFTARITVNWKEIYIGTFDTLDEAKGARIHAEEKYHGDFAQHLRK